MMLIGAAGAAWFVVPFLDRDSQKGIIIGHQGKAIKKVGYEARKDIEEFFGKK